jgi:SAM-dependent methyltransferase
MKPAERQVSGGAGAMQTNHELWDARAEPHFRSAFYDVGAFRRGATSLTPVEIEALGDVAGKSMLHLQCHFGQDTLSWARRGARVTGVDFSESAIALANRLRDELVIDEPGLDARFVWADVYDLEHVLDETFDVVFTSYGVLKWLPDISRWAQVVSRFVSPGGRFYLVEFHPFLYVFDYERAERAEHAYFYQPQPLSYLENGSYADPAAHGEMIAHAWSHPVSSVINALVDAGLTVRRFDEFPYSSINCFPFVREAEPGRYVHATLPRLFPLMYSVLAEKR